MIRVWAKDEPFGTELADVTIAAGALAATGVAVGIDPVPYRLEYELDTIEGYVTARLLVTAQGAGWRRAIDLQRAASGEWWCTTEAEGAIDLPSPGGDLAAVAGALDCDLALSPLTNSMPVLRLHEGSGPVDFLMAWVSVPDLAVHASRQRYTFIRKDPEARIVRFESRDSSFVADLRFDDGGLVIDYPGIARRVA